MIFLMLLRGRTFDCKRGGGGKGGKGLGIDLLARCEVCWFM